MDRFPLQCGKFGTLRQAHGGTPEFGPAPIKIDQVARGDLPSLLVFALVVIAPGIVHAERLTQAVVSGGVKKA
jgi:hypothetical protein